ncbi:MAG: hypothetical protein IJU14_03320 [Clostridia bacterium]|nr:hypothetical protein [Clostridia bacterium]
MSFWCTLLLVNSRGVFLFWNKGDRMLSDGEYNIDVDLTGGSGKATVKSPTKLKVTNGKMQAEIEWSSSHYDYMEVDEKPYYPQNTEGNSLFLIDVVALDKDIPVKAETTAMSTPHTIEYTLHFSSETATQSTDNGIPTTVFLGVGAVIIAIAFAKNFRHKGKKHEVTETV